MHVLTRVPQSKQDSKKMQKTDNHQRKWNKIDFFA